jgi:hypothetical protein
MDSRNRLSQFNHRRLLVETTEKVKKFTWRCGSSFGLKGRRLALFELV